jgi:hypothetical protein
MPPRTDDRTRPTHILPAITARKWTALDYTAHVGVHVYIHAIVYTLKWCIAVVAARTLCLLLLV